MTSILSLTYDELRRQLADAGLGAYRADQLCDWVYAKGVTEPAAMTNLPAAVKERWGVLSSRQVATSESQDGTTKLLLEYPDGARVETVLIPADGRRTACVSTQAGCAMGCAFCASGASGLTRNLTGAEILEQLLHLRAGGERISHVVFMGVGEPLANYDATIFAVRAIVDLKRFAISARHVTVSTVGLPRMIRRLADEDLPVTLAISLHAPNDALRRKLMPAARSTTIDDIVEAGRYFFESRKREVTLEYVLLAGVNDTNVCAEALAGVAQRLRCSVNLIRYNPVAELGFEAPSPDAVEDFARRLKRRGVNVQVRRSRGEDVAAACGQLRAIASKEEHSDPSA
jgi:23S rRNA (adenine2503-C2)-methyltransferase